MKKPGKFALWFLLFAGAYFLFRESADLIRLHQVNEVLLIEQFQEQKHRLIQEVNFLAWGRRALVRQVEADVVKVLEERTQEKVGVLNMDTANGLASDRPGHALQIDVNVLQVMDAKARPVQRDVQLKEDKDFKAGEGALEPEDVSHLEKDTSHFRSSKEPAERGKTPSLQGDRNLAIYNRLNQTAVLTRPRIVVFGDTLSSGEVLRTGEKLVSTNSMYTFVNQGDGNLVLYNQHGRATWASGTDNQGGGNRLYLQSDGQLVLYKTDGGVSRKRLRTGTQIWSSAIRNARLGPHKLIMQDDGNLVIYDASHRPIWATNTWTK